LLTFLPPRWLFSTLLPSDQSNGHTLFDPQQSQTFKLLDGSTFAITFGDQSSASGDVVGTDLVEIGGVSVTQAVELANNGTV
jgi:aspergillopepsin I